MPHVGRPSRASPRVEPNTPEIQAGVASITAEALRLFADRTEQMTRDLEEFNRMQREVQESLRRGARRTSGHIV